MPTTTLPPNPTTTPPPPDRPAGRGRPLVLVLGAAALLAFSGWRQPFLGRGPRPADPRPTSTGTRSAGGSGRTTPQFEAATELDPGLVSAFAEARRAASSAGKALQINSGLRSPARQQELLDDAIEEHGSREAALRWVFEPERSMHVRGLAIDVGDGPAADWLDANGGRFGLCRTLAWEWWHFEWRPAWEAAGGCPDPVHDPADAPTVATGR